MRLTARPATVFFMAILIRANICGQAGYSRSGLPGTPYSRPTYWPRRSWHVTLPRLRRRTLIFMTVLAVGAALMAALYVGYHCGRRTGARQSHWRTRTSRITMGMLAANLVGLVVARRLQRTPFAQRALPMLAGARGFSAPMTRRPAMRLQMLRASAPRRRRGR